MEFRSCQRRCVVPLCCGDCDACQTGWVRHEPQQHNEYRNIFGPLSENARRREADEKVSGPWRRECRRRSSTGPVCGRGGGIAGRPPRRDRQERRRQRRPRSWHKLGDKAEAWMGNGYRKHGGPLSGLPGTCRSQLLSGPRRRRVDGRRAKRASRRAAGYGSGRITERKGRPRAGYRRGSGPAEDKEEAGQAGRCRCLRTSGCIGGGVQGTRSRSTSIAASGRTDLVPVVELAGSLPIFGKMQDVVVRAIRYGVVDTPGDRADVLAVNGDRVLVLAGTAER